MDRRRFLTGAGAAALLGRAALAQYQPQGRELVARIIALQADDGALLLPGQGVRRCDPHLANVAMRGVLLGAPPRSRNAAAAAAKAWLEWCFRNAQAKSALPVHEGQPGSLKAVAGPGTVMPQASLLSLAFAYLDQAGDDRVLLESFPKLVAAAEALLGPLQRSGVLISSAAKGSVLLTENVAAWHGWDSFARLAERLKRKGEASEYRAQADALLEAIDKWLWIQREGCYATEIPADGTKVAHWDRWREHWVPNLQAIAELPEDERRTDLIRRAAKRYTESPGFGTPFRVVVAGLKRPTIESPADLDQMLAWGLVVLSRHDQAELERFQVILSKAPWEKLSDLDPAQIGTAIRIGGGKCSPAPDADPETGLFPIG